MVNPVSSAFAILFPHYLTAYCMLNKSLVAGVVNVISYGSYKASPILGVAAVSVPLTAKLSQCHHFFPSQLNKITKNKQGLIYSGIDSIRSSLLIRCQFRGMQCYKFSYGSC